MMLRFVLLIVLSIVISRMLSRLARAFKEGIRGAQGSRQVPTRGVAMVRDPICGTFVLPERAVTLVHGRSRVHFCSEACRDKYRAQRESVEGRTA